ncbi:Dehydrogenase reductase SDR family member 7B [Fusarium phyllophilum]|uniref:Dehydrogenase reductase SDR family member 7B n=1 Tax=Fusarium phyllophilum TaxID=47803 RepID=A0A8H5MMY9_9HYPO|nr:Dehydrogenase reductase SDR family member 7B [Fusarium phyllophilum]
MAQYPPRLHNEIYSFIEPAKFRGSLKGRVVLLTGAAGTIGQALAQCFAVAGATLVLVYNRTVPSPELKNNCATLGAGPIYLIKCNISDYDDCQGLVGKVWCTSFLRLFLVAIMTFVGKEIGVIDILINNAGTDHLGPTHSLEPNRMLEGLKVNLLGPFYLTQLAMRGFMERRQGCVINIASRGGTADIPFNTVYCTAKAALIRMTSCWQAELDLMGLDNIQLYALHPGAVPSKLTSSDGLSNFFADYPQAMESFLEILKGFKDTPYLSGMTSVALATGIAKEVLRGKYFDAQHDLEDVIAQASVLKANPELYTLAHLLNVLLF